MLLFPILKLKGYTLTNLTPSKTVSTILERLGFTKIDNDVIILPALPLKFYKTINLSYKIDKSMLSPEELKIYEENKDYQVQFGIITDSLSHCLFAYRIRKKKGIRFIYMLYLSNTELFYNHIQNIRYELCKKTKTAMIMFDSRLLDNRKVRFSIVLSGKFPKFFKTNLTDLTLIDNLNSEFVFLNM